MYGTTLLELDIACGVPHRTLNYALFALVLLAPAQECSLDRRVKTYIHGSKNGCEISRARKSCLGIVLTIKKGIRVGYLVFTN